MKKGGLAECALLPIKRKFKIHWPAQSFGFPFFISKWFDTSFSVIMQLGIQKRKKRDGGENRQAKVNVLQIDTDTRKMLSFIYIKEWKRIEAALGMWITVTVFVTCECAGKVLPCHNCMIVMSVYVLWLQENAPYSFWLQKKRCVSCWPMNVGRKWSTIACRSWKAHKQV